MKRKASIVCTTVMLFLITAGLAAAAYPDKPIQIINPSAPGGSNDVIGRIFATVAEKYLGQPMVMVNKTGGSGTVATLYSRDAKPDGYIVMTNTGSRNALMAGEYAKGKEPPFKWKDFQALGIVTNSPSMLTVLYDSPWKTVNELVVDMKAKPDFFKFCSSGGYGGSHLPMEMFMLATGTAARHVAYKGGGPCIQATLGGHFNITTQFASTTRPLVRGKKMRWLATTAAKRQKLIPDIPTLKELGIDVVYTMFIGFFTQKDTPKPIVDKLRDVTYKVAHDKQFIDLVEKTGQEVAYMNPTEAVAHADKELEQFTKTIKLIESRNK